MLKIGDTVKTPIGEVGTIDQIRFGYTKREGEHDPNIPRYYVEGQQSESSYVWYLEEQLIIVDPLTDSERADLATIHQNHKFIMNKMDREYQDLRYNLQQVFSREIERFFRYRSAKSPETSSTQSMSSIDAPPVPSLLGFELGQVIQYNDLRGVIADLLLLDKETAAVDVLNEQGGLSGHPVEYWLLKDCTLVGWYAPPSSKES